MVFAYTFKGILESATTNTPGIHASSVIDTYYYPYYYVSLKINKKSDNKLLEESSSTDNFEEIYSSRVLGQNISHEDGNDWNIVNIPGNRYIRFWYSSQYEGSDAELQLHVRLLNVAPKVDTGNTGTFIKDANDNPLDSIIDKYTALAVYNTTTSEKVIKFNDVKNIPLMLDTGFLSLTITSINITNLSPYNTIFLKIYDEIDIDNNNITTYQPVMVFPVFKESNREIVLHSPYKSTNKIFIRATNDDSPLTNEVVVNIFYNEHNIIDNGNTGSNTGSA